MCWAPQHICHLWEENEERGWGFRRRKRACCQYLGVLKEAVAAMLGFTDGEVQKWVYLELQKKGIVLGDDE